MPSTATNPTNNNNNNKAISIKLPKLHPGQTEVVNTASRFNVLAMGRRYGKSTLLLDRITHALLNGQRVAWFSPTYKMLSDSWREAIALLGPVITKSNVQERFIETITGGSLDFWSLDTPDAARGRKYNLICVDEAAMLKDLDYIWPAVLRPTLTDYKGSAWFASTPKGSNYFYTLWQMGQDPLEGEWSSWQMPTTANPHIDPAEVEAARLSIPAIIFKQEYLAEFNQNGGSVFRNVDDCVFEKLESYKDPNYLAKLATVNGEVNPALMLKLANESATTGNYTFASDAAVFIPKRFGQPYDGRFVMGLDWAMNVDFTVITVIDADTHQVVDMQRFNQLDFTYQRDRVKEMADKWDVMTIVSEHNSIGGPNEEELIKDGLPIESFVTSPKTKPPLIESLALAFEQQDVWIPNDPVLLSELKAYERKTSATGRPQYSAPPSGHDDTVMSLALAFYGAVNHRQPLFGFVGPSASVSAR